MGIGVHAVFKTGTNGPTFASTCTRVVIVTGVQLSMGHTATAYRWLQLQTDITTVVPFWQQAGTCKLKHQWIDDLSYAYSPLL